MLRPGALKIQFAQVHIVDPKQLRHLAQGEGPQSARCVFGEKLFAVCVQPSRQAGSEDTGKRANLICKATGG